MLIIQFYDDTLAHASYAIISAGEMAVVDPARDPSPYYQLAREQRAGIKAVIETHPHADFVSSHREIAETTGAVILVSRLLGAAYPHQGFDDGDVFRAGKVTLHAMNTPGHSPDSICILLKDENGKDYALFTGDTLFVGDVGRPDLRENVGNLKAKAEELARAMYRSTREKIMPLNPDLYIYPAHGAGSLCGKNLSEDTFSTLGRELRENYALQEMDEETFVQRLIANQPFVPAYFPFDVEINKSGAPAFEESIRQVHRLPAGSVPEGEIRVIDHRPPEQFRAGHVPGSLNLPDDSNLETWLGTLVAPGEPFYLIAENETTRENFIRRAAKIGYETQIKGACLVPPNATERSRETDLQHFHRHQDDYLILDIRNVAEYAEGPFFEDSLNIPLPELNQRSGELPAGKPLMVHCLAGYRSAIGSSLLATLRPDLEIHDLGPAVKQFKPTETG